jgi:hypothetical protein
LRSGSGGTFAGAAVLLRSRGGGGLSARWRVASLKKRLRPAIKYTPPIAANTMNGGRIFTCNAPTAALMGWHAFVGPAAG